MSTTIEKKIEVENKSDKLIDKACNNFKNISKNIRNKKFEHIDTWVHKTSTLYKKENKENINPVYPRYDFGTIIKVDFGINLGSELSGPHFAITLERYDSTKNPVITVLPLTSHHSKNRNLELNDLILEEFTKRLNKNLNRIKSELNTMQIKLYEEKFQNEEEQKLFKNTIKLKINEIKKIEDMVKYYSNYAKNSYACLNQITTISKEKIIKPKNEFDIIGRSKCNCKTMQIISKEIIKKFTNIQLISEYDLTK